MTAATVSGPSRRSPTERIAIQAGTGRRARALGFLGAIPISVWMVVFFLLPFLLILWYSFGYKPDIYSAVSNAHLSFGRYSQALTPTFIAIFWRTLGIAAVGTLLALVIAYPMAYWMAVVVPARWRGLVLALVLVPYWTNFLVRTLGWAVLLSGGGPISTLLQALGGQPLQALNTVGAVQLGVVYNYLPLMILPIYVALERLDPRYLEASRDLGANAVRTFWRITLPLSVPGVAAGLLLVFVPLMGDYITPSVLGGAKGSMAGQMVAGQFTNAQNWALGSAMAILLMIAIFGVTAIAGGVLKLLGRLLDHATRLVPTGARS